MSDTYKLDINEYTRNTAATKADIVEILSGYVADDNILRTHQYGNVTPTELAEHLCALPRYRGGRTVDVYNAPICALGKTFGTVTVS
jgi:hypothetical protein